MHWHVMIGIAVGLVIIAIICFSRRRSETSRGLVGCNGAECKEACERLSASGTGCSLSVCQWCNDTCCSINNMTEDGKCTDATALQNAIDRVCVSETRILHATNLKPKSYSNSGKGYLYTAYTLTGADFIAMSTHIGAATVSLAGQPLVVSSYETSLSADNTTVEFRLHTTTQQSGDLSVSVPQGIVTDVTYAGLDGTMFIDVSGETATLEISQETWIPTSLNAPWYYQMRTGDHAQNSHQSVVRVRASSVTKDATRYVLELVSGSFPSSGNLKLAQFADRSFTAPPLITVPEIEILSKCVDGCVQLRSDVCGSKFCTDVYGFSDQCRGTCSASNPYLCLSESDLVDAMNTSCGEDACERSCAYMMERYGTDTACEMSVCRTIYPELCVRKAYGLANWQNGARVFLGISGDKIIKTSDEHPWIVGNGQLISIEGIERCAKKSNDEIVLAPCDRTDPSQYFTFGIPDTTGLTLRHNDQCITFDVPEGSPVLLQTCRTTPYMTAERWQLTR